MSFDTTLIDVTYDHIFHLQSIHKQGHRNQVVKAIQSLKKPQKDILLRVLTSSPKLPTASELSKLNKRFEKKKQSNYMLNFVGCIKEKNKFPSEEERNLMSEIQKFQLPEFVKPSQLFPIFRQCNIKFPNEIYRRIFDEVIVQSNLTKAKKVGILLRQIKIFWGNDQAINEPTRFHIKEVPLRLLRPMGFKERDWKLLLPRLKNVNLLEVELSLVHPYLSQCRAIETLTLSSIQAIDLPYVPFSKQLTSLIIANGSLSQETLVKVLKEEKCPNLKDLKFSNCHLQRSDREYLDTQLPQAMPSLKVTLLNCKDPFPKLDFFDLMDAEGLY